MVFERLTQDNVEDYIAYLKIAMGEEPVWLGESPLLRKHLKI